MKADAVIKAAAVADYRPKQVFDRKLKKTEGDLTLELERNLPDVPQAKDPSSGSMK